MKTTTFPRELWGNIFLALIYLLTAERSPRIWQSWMGEMCVLNFSILLSMSNSWDAQYWLRLCLSLAFRGQCSPQVRNVLATYSVSKWEPCEATHCLYPPDTLSHGGLLWSPSLNFTIFLCNWALLPEPHSVLTIVPWWPIRVVSLLNLSYMRWYKSHYALTHHSQLSVLLILQ